MNTRISSLVRSLVAGSLFGCTVGEFQPPDSTGPSNPEEVKKSPASSSYPHNSGQYCGMESCAPVGVLVGTGGALHIPVTENYDDTPMPAWSPVEGEMVRMHVQQRLMEPHWALPGHDPCYGPDCWTDPQPRFCEVTDQNGRVLWRQTGDADQWVHLRGVTSIQTRVFVNSHHMDSLDFCDVTEIEVVDSPQVGEPDSSCATYFATDFSDPMDETLSINGDAYQRGYDDAGHLLLTEEPWVWFPDIYPLVSKQAGSAFATSAISDPAWRVRFSFEIGGGTGADGLTFAFVDARTPDVIGGKGSGMGVKGLWGYAIEFDTYRNDNDPNDNHIALIDTLTGEHLVVASDIPRLHDGGLFDAEVLYDSGHLEMWLDGVHTLEATLSNVPNYVQSAAILGFTAATGSDYNNHIVDDVIIQPLCDGSGGDPDPQGTGEESTESGTLSPEEWAHFGPFEVASGTLVATMTGTGDADLHVRKGAQPTTRDYDCRPYTVSSDEECRLEGAGSYYVSVRGYSTPQSTYELQVAIEEADATAASQEEWLSLEQGEWQHFVPMDGRRLDAWLTGTGDADLYVRQGAEPTESSWDCRPYRADSNEECHLEGVGPWFLAVHAYTPATYQLLSSTSP